MILIGTHRVPLLPEKQRLQEYAVGKFDQLNSRSAVKKAIKKGFVFINSEKGHTGDWIEGGETIELYRQVDEKSPIVELELKVLYEDPHLAIINKPAGILVSGNKRRTVANALAFNLTKSPEPDALIQPEPIHRLDFPTTGALLVGKTAGIVPKLNALFEQREIRKTYLAVTSGELPEEGVIESAIDGKPARSEFEILDSLASEKYGSLNLVKILPHTGRRHQLRKHLSEMGSPIFGDKDYASPQVVVKGRSLYLHALSLRFNHPINDTELVAFANPPKKFKRIFPFI